MTESSYIANAKLAIRGVVDQALRQSDVFDKLNDRIVGLNVEVGAWRDEAMRHLRNEQYYRELLVKVGELFGVEAKTSDDGSVQQDVLVARVPELVEKLVKQMRQVDDVLTVSWVGPRKDGDYKQTLADLVQLSLNEATYFAKQDAELLDKLQVATTGYGKGWMLRESGEGRGLRLQETSRDGAVKTVRGAIEKYFADKEPA